MRNFFLHLWWGDLIVFCLRGGSKSYGLSPSLHSRGRSGRCWQSWGWCLRATLRSQLGNNSFFGFLKKLSWEIVDSWSRDSITGRQGQLCLPDSIIVPVLGPVFGSRYSLIGWILFSVILSSLYTSPWLSGFCCGRMVGFRLGMADHDRSSPVALDCIICWSIEFYFLWFLAVCMLHFEVLDVFMVILLAFI